jgi:hypothetical protein
LPTVIPRRLPHAGLKDPGKEEAPMSRRVSMQAIAS